MAQGKHFLTLVFSTSHLLQMHILPDKMVWLLLQMVNHFQKLSWWNLKPKQMNSKLYLNFKIDLIFVSILVLYYQADI